MKRFLKIGLTMILACIMALSVCLLASCGDQTGNENNGGNDADVKGYNIKVNNLIDLGEVKSTLKGAQSGGALYEIVVTPKIGYAVKSFKINGAEVALKDNKLECVLKKDVELTIDYQRKTSEELEKRQQTVIDKMDQYTGTYFKYDKDYSYTLNGKAITLTAGVLYGGLPYTAYSAISPDAYLDFATSQDANGVYKMSFPTGNNPLYWGGSCGNAVYWALSTVSSSIKFTYSRDMTEKNGVYTVGVFDYDKETDLANGLWQDTKAVCDKNGIDVMSKAYSMMNKGDAMTTMSTKWNHVILVTDIDLVEGADGSINYSRSTITFMDQNGGYGTKTGKNGVSVISSCAYNATMTFAQLFDDGYLPVTVIELLDDSTPLAKAEATDSLKAADLNKLNVTRGYIDTNYAVSKVVMTLTDANGNKVYEATRHGVEDTPTRFGFSAFTSNNGGYDTANVYNDAIELASIASGEYRCVATVYFSNGESAVARDFTFTN